MENFSRVDIFDTKGAEYLFVIAYLIALLIFWIVSGKQIKLKKQLQETLSNFSANILRIPQGLFYNINHTWTHLNESGEAKVGLDDFLQHIVGKVKLVNLKKTGDIINKGDLLADLVQNGKQLKIYSPISGKVLDINEELHDNPEVLNENPYQQGWIYKIKPTKWMEETSSYYLAEDAVNWTKSEISRFKDFLAGGAMKKYSLEPSMVILQDGGEIRDQVLSELPENVWNEFQVEFLDLPHRKT